MIKDIQVGVLDAYPTRVDRTYSAAATLLAVWGIVFSFTATAFGEVTADRHAPFGKVFKICARDPVC